MKIYNFSSYDVSIDGVVMEGQVSEVPDAYRGTLEIGTAVLPWEDDPYQYLMIYEDGGLQVEHPIVTPPPFVNFFWLFVCVFGMCFFVKLLQKIKST